VTAPHAPETHIVAVWERALPALDRILDDAARRFVIHDVVRVTWRPDCFRRNLVRLYGTALPADSDKERECGPGPFVVIVVGDEQPQTVARRGQGAWAPANAALLRAKRRYRRWAGGSYRVHTTLTTHEAEKDAVLVLGEQLGALRTRTWTGDVRERPRDLLGEPEWTRLEELEVALTATMTCVLLPPEHEGGPMRVVSDDSWWAIRIADPGAADGTRDPEERLRRPMVAGAELPLLVLDADDPDVGHRLVPAVPAPVHPSFIDRLATLARLRR